VDRFFTGLEMKSKARAAKRRTEDLDQLQRDVDRLLEKVHREGLDGLTPKERKFLTEASRRLSKERP
jgi:hypothetical protein